MKFEIPPESARKATQQENIRQEPFIHGLLARIPKESRGSFTDQQLLALKVALSGRRWGHHLFDIRGVFGFWRWKYYYVLVGGRERRSLSRREEELSRLGKALFLLFFCAFCALFGLLILYLIKSALGIDLFPGYHLNIIPGYNGSTWKWFKENFF